ncbi:RNA polymerase sigma factor [Abyssalbus ytuae]|uniref:Sigma-70 family RNA polymerase sigma factor n=1 Tax=Abyssalbus ytuae TaxID=2926907 RepID=A0A9E6ZSK9_9FLAO|nr:sigma-70 family RNA polymerase sigma factor [Abyssalbus ytuae]UOB17098.1 sigma-70 family RNA polymerase sigma factor [Abyssalbus ytuae]
MDPIQLTIKKLKDGDIKVLEKVYKKYYSRVYYFAKKFNINSHLLTDDLVQQTFLKIWENRDQLKEDILFEKQLYTISKNIILNHLKREKYYQDLQENKYSEIHDKAISENYIEENLIQQETEDTRIQFIYTKIKELPAKRREVFELYKLKGLSYEEISVILKISKSTIANHLQLATSFLKKEYDKQTH